jgi:FkbM family methyltransferase
MYVYKSIDIYDIISQFRDNMTIIECGFHIGNDTKNLCKIFKNGNIYSLEANKDLYEKLLNLKDKYNNLKLFNYAIYDKTGQNDFYIDSNPHGDSGASSCLKSTENYLNNYVKIENKIIVDSITLKDFILLNNINKIDILWLDIEGYEYYILNNSIDILDKIEFIYLSVSFQEFRENYKLYKDIKYLLENNNFNELIYWEKGDTWGKWKGNVLFKNNKI